MLAKRALVKTMKVSCGHARCGSGEQARSQLDTMVCKVFRTAKKCSEETNDMPVNRSLCMDGIVLFTLENDDPRVGNLGLLLRH